MKKNICWMILLFLASSCQNELYKNPLDEFQSEQGVYIAAKAILQIFVVEDKDTKIDRL